MYDSILLATDGSPGTREAVSHGLTLAETYGATVHALFVVDVRAIGLDDEDFAGDDAIIDVLERRGERATGEIARQAGDLGVDAIAEVVHGTPAREIRTHATDHGADLIVMGTHGRRGVARFVLGSVAESVVGNATQPVLTARAVETPRDPAYDDVLLPTDGSRHDERVVDHAFDIAARYDSTVHALSVIDSSLVYSPIFLAALEEAAEAAISTVKRRGREAGVDVVSSVWKGTPSDCITSYADERDVDMITMGTHGRRGLDRFLTPSVARRVIRTANCPVLTLRRESDAG